ncbi:MAG: hypothetical protein ACRCY5_01955, partial [Phocaeicola sp.]
TTTQDWIVGSANEKKETYIPVDIDFSINKAYNFSVNFGTGNGGYDDDGAPIIDQKEMIQFDTNFSDWDDETIIPVPQPESLPEMKFTIKTEADGEEFIFPFGATMGDPQTTGEYTTQIAWGDGKITIINPKTAIAVEDLTHTYATAGQYSVTIASSETDFTKEQAPTISPIMNSGGKEAAEEELPFDPRSLKIISIDSPLLRMGTEKTGNVLAGTFGTQPLTQIHEDLFKYNPQIIHFIGVFAECKKLTTISGKLFNECTEAESLEGIFEGCESLTTIPAGLFAKNKKATAFYNVFAGCTSAIVEKNLFCNEDTEKDTRFAGIAPDFDSAFKNVGSALTDVRSSFLPELWSYTYEDGVGEPYSKTSCFKDAKASNFGNVDDGWK